MSEAPAPGPSPVAWLPVALHVVSVVGFAVAAFGLFGSMFLGPFGILVILPVAMAAYHGQLGLLGGAAGAVAVVVSSIAGRRGDTRWTGAPAAALLVVTVLSGCCGGMRQISFTELYVSEHHGVTTLEYVNTFDSLYMHWHCPYWMCRKSDDQQAPWKTVGSP